MSDFSYEPPDCDDYLSALLVTLESSSERDLVHVLAGATCSISVSSSFSGLRWNAYSAEVYFYLQPSKLGLVTQKIRERLQVYCDRVMPKDAGLDVLMVDFSAQLGACRNGPGLTDEIAELTDKLSSTASLANLPQDLLDRGREMAELYLYLYCVENVLRLYIESVAKASFGDGYMSHLAVPKSVRDAISLRRRNEARQRWLSVRGGSELFYIDLKDLADIIANNWSLFKDKLPSQAWIND